MTTATTTKVKELKGYEIVAISVDRKTLSCKVRLPKIGVSKDLFSIATAKAWINLLDSGPLEMGERLTQES